MYYNLEPKSRNKISLDCLQADSSPAANSGAAGRRRRRQSDDASSSLRDARSSARSDSEGEDLLGDDMMYVLFGF